jgi:hypothetical protein
MDIAQISILGWTILTLIVIAILLCYEGAKFLLDVALAGLIIVLLWTYWHRNQHRITTTVTGPLICLRSVSRVEIATPTSGMGCGAEIGAATV